MLRRVLESCETLLWKGNKARASCVIQFAVKLWLGPLLTSESFAFVFVWCHQIGSERIKRQRDVGWTIKSDYRLTKSFPHVVKLNQGRVLPGCSDQVPFVWKSYLVNRLRNILVWNSLEHFKGSDIPKVYCSSLMPCCQDKTIWLESYVSHARFSRNFTNFGSFNDVKDTPILVGWANNTEIRKLWHEFNRWDTLINVSLINLALVIEAPSLKFLLISNDSIFSSWHELHYLNVFDHISVSNLLLFFGHCVVQTQARLFRFWVFCGRDNLLVFLVDVQALDAWNLRKRMNCLFASEGWQLALLWVWIWSFQVFSNSLRFLAKSFQFVFQFFRKTLRSLFSLRLILLLLNLLCFFELCLVLRKLILSHLQNGLNVFIFFHKSSNDPASSIVLVQRVSQLLLRLVQISSKVVRVKHHLIPLFLKHRQDRGNTICN